MIRVLLADDHDIVRAGLRRLVENEADIEVVGEVADASEVLPSIQRTKPHVLVLDISMPGPGVLNVLDSIKEAAPACRTIVLSMHPEEEYATRVIGAGAAGYLTKDSTTSHLVEAVRRAGAGGIYVTSAVGELLAGEVANRTTSPLADQLSERERQVLTLLGRGYSTKRIAATLSISPKTVSTFRSRLLSKLGLSSTAELIRYAINQERQ